MFQEIFNSKNPSTVNEVLKLRDELLKSGKINELTLNLKNSLPENKASIGKELQNLKAELKEISDNWIQKLQQQNISDEKIQEIDPTFYVANKSFTNKKLHPITQVTNSLVEIYRNLGFNLSDGPLIESQWYNFTALNIPDHHPARGMQDTFFLNHTDKQNQNLVLRTQTSSVQIRYMQTHKPPFKVIIPGLVFRNEDLDATHDMQFNQLEGLVVDKTICIANLKYLLEQTFKKFFEDENVEIRLRPSYFPFVSPGYEVDIQCPFCKGKGCRTCKQTGWIECVGAGLVHPNVLKNVGINPEQWQGLAFGFGVDRLAQMKLGITGLTQFYNSNLNFLES